MPLSLSLPQLLLLLILIGVFALLLSERIRIDLTALIIIILLTISGILTPEEAVSGFSSEPAIVVAAIFVLSESLFRTGLSDKLGDWIGRLAGNGYNRMLVVIMLAVAALAAFTHHVTITAIMLPVTLKLCRQSNIAPSRLLMPMSFAASLGTTITILGAPAFLIADDLLRQIGRPGLGIFSIAPIGLSLSVAGALFMLLVGRFLLPERGGAEDSNGSFQLNNYYTEVIVLPNSRLEGQTVAKIEADEAQAMRIVNWLRHGRPLNRPFNDDPIQAGDVLLVRTTPDGLAAIQEAPGVALHPVLQYGDDVHGNNGREARDADEESSSRLAQAIIAPGSPLIGQNIGQADFRQRYNTIVVGIWRRKGWLQTELSRIKMRAGDVLVLLGDEETFARLGEDRSFLVLVPFHGQPLRRHKASLAGGIMVGTILLAAFNILPLEVALLVGVVLVLLTRCLTAQQAYQAIDMRIYVFIAGAIPLGLAMVKTGMAELMGGWLEGFVGGWHPTLVLVLLFLVAAAITQLMSDSATTALLAPVAVALATALHRAPEPFVVTVAMAAVASFFTPIGHHGNLLIYGPGRYLFRDFLRVGTPLTLVVALIVALLSQLLWSQ
ncbi:MAG: SLC13 family permease [Chloroflexi bacterium]|nr:SLC13 family permease [Chloroflexota bacterium]